MSYPKRDWDNTGNEVTKEDFKRIENGIEINDTAITEQGKQINVLKTKTEVSCTPKTGFTINSQKNIVMGGRVQFNMYISKTDLTAFSANTSVAVADVPINYRPTVTTNGTLYGYGGGSFVIGDIIIEVDGTVYLIVSGSGATNIKGTCEVIL